MTDGGARGFTYLFISLWKIGLFLMCMSLMVPLANVVPEFYSLYTEFSKSFESNDFIIRYDGDVGERIIAYTDQLIGWEKLWKSPGEKICSF